MQAQTTGSRWFKFNPIMVLTLAAGIVLAVAALAVGDVIDLPYASESETASAPSVGQQAERPYASRPLDRPATFDQSGPIHANGGEHRATTSELSETLTGSVQSTEQMRFYEQNVWEYSDTNPEATGIHRDEGFIH